MPPPLPYLPWTTHPLIINAPMAAPTATAGPALATAVTSARGLGLLGAGANPSTLRTQLESATTTLRASSNPLIAHSDTLPIGIGLILFALDLDAVVPLVRAARPAVLWLFAARELDEYAVWAAALRGASPDSRIWVQTGSVGAALHVARTAKPDALCMQGADAGGHGFERGAGVISLVPETVDALAREGMAHVAVLAAGGIADGRGVAAAMALGAKGVVLGTRFLGSREIEVSKGYQDAVLEAGDGGQSTVRSKVFDELVGRNVWPRVYDGRSLAVRSWKEREEGVSVEEVQRRHGEEVKGPDGGFKLGLEGRAAVWAGTGVGLVREVEGAAEIVESVRKGAREVLAELAKV